MKDKYVSINVSDKFNVCVLFVNFQNIFIITLNCS